MKLKTIILIIFIIILVVILIRILKEKILSLYKNDEEYFKAKLEKDPQNKKIMMKYVKYLKENNRYNEAIVLLYEIIENDIENSEAYYELGILLKENDRRSDAIRIMENLVGFDNSSKNLNLLGSLYYENSEFKRALSTYKKALELDPKNYDLYYNLGMTYTALNNFNKAQEFYEKAATINSYKEIAKLNIGQIYILLKEYEEAQKYFFETKDSEDDFVAAYSYYYLAKISIINDDYEKAIIYSNTAISLNSDIKKVMEKDQRFYIILSKLNRNMEKGIKINNKLEKNIKYLDEVYDKVDMWDDNIELKIKKKTMYKEKNR